MKRSLVLLTISFVFIFESSGANSVLSLSQSLEMAKNVLIEIRDPEPEVTYTLFLIDLDHSIQKHCGNNMFWGTKEEGELRLEFFLEEWKLQPNNFQTFYCAENESDGNIIMIDRETSRAFSRSPHYAAEVVLPNRPPIHILGDSIGFWNWGAPDRGWLEGELKKIVTTVLTSPFEKNVKYACTPISDGIQDFLCLIHAIDDDEDAYDAASIIVERSNNGFKIRRADTYSFK